MSGGQAIPRAEALRVAESIVDYLAEGCTQIAIAGSLRREKAEVHDIEIVAEPRIVMRPGNELFPVEHETDLLEEKYSELLHRVIVVPRVVENKRADGSIDVQTKIGPRFKALLVGYMPLDLFIVRPPATWGVVFGLRTGPGDWNTRLVTECKTIGRRVREGQVEAWRAATSSWEPVPTPDERSFFHAVGQTWLEPRDRHVDRVRIQRLEPVAEK